MILCEGMRNRDVRQMKQRIEEVPHVERMEALKDAGDGYNSFSGLADGMKGSVKFIIRSDSISAES